MQAIGCQFKISFKSAKSSSSPAASEWCLRKTCSLPSWCRGSHRRLGAGFQTWPWLDPGRRRRPPPSASGSWEAALGLEVNMGHPYQEKVLAGVKPSFEAQDYIGDYKGWQRYATRKRFVTHVLQVWPIFLSLDFEFISVSWWNQCI